MAQSSPLRADALERRRRLLAAASALITDEGIDVPMERIAKAAGVGVGTLYRRFPDRTSLVVAVVLDGLERTYERLREVLDGEASAWEGFRVAAAHPERTNVGLRGRLSHAPELAAAVDADPEVRRLRRQVADTVGDVVAAAQAEGSMRADVGVGDVMLLLDLLSRRNVPVGAPRRTTERLHALVLDALAASPGGALPGDPMGVAEVWGQDR